MEVVKLGSPNMGALVGVGLGLLVVVAAISALVKIRRGDVIPIRGHGIIGRFVVQLIFGEQLGYGGATLGLAFGLGLTYFASWAWTSDATAISVDVAGSPVLAYPFPRGSARIEPATIRQLELHSRSEGRCSLHLATTDGEERSTVPVARETAVVVMSAVWTKLGRRVPVMECGSDSRSCSPTVEPTLRERSARSRH